MSNRTHRRIATLALLSFTFLIGRNCQICAAEEDDPKTPILLPKDPKAVVLTYDPGAGGFVRKGPAPYLKILGDGTVTVTNVHDGTVKDSKLTAKELDSLLKFVIEESGFFKITEKGISDGIKEASAKGPFIAVNGAGTSVIMVQTDKKKHEASYRGASAYLSTYPKVELLGKYVAIEKKLSEFADGIAKAK